MSHKMCVNVTPQNLNLLVLTIPWMCSLLLAQLVLLTVSVAGLARPLGTMGLVLAQPQC